MKKLLSLVLICLLAIPSFAGAEVFEAAAGGFGGEVKVTLNVEDGKIVEATVVGDSETPGIGAAALEPLAAQLVEAGNADIAGVSGATVTSDAAKAAAAAALPDDGRQFGEGFGPPLRKENQHGMQEYLPAL